MIPLNDHETSLIRNILSAGSQMTRDKWTTIDRPADSRNLESVENLCGMDLVKRLRTLKERFKGETLRVLYEGSGLSTLPEELERKCA